MYSRIFIPLDGDEGSGDSITTKFSKHVACESAAARQLLSRTDVDEHATRATFAFFVARQPPPISPQPLTVRATLPPMIFIFAKIYGNSKSQQEGDSSFQSLLEAEFNYVELVTKGGKKCNVGSIRKFLTY